MIPNNNPNLVALYKHDDPKPYTSSKEIIGWDDDDVPMVVSDTRPYRLVPADTYRNYVGIGEDSLPRIIAVIPADGWRVEWMWEGETASEPLVGWALRADGCVVPLATDSHGDVDAIDPYSDVSEKPRIYHPDATQPKTEEAP